MVFFIATSVFSYLAFVIFSCLYSGVNCVGDLTMMGQHLWCWLKQITACPSGFVVTPTVRPMPEWLLAWTRVYIHIWSDSLYQDFCVHASRLMKGRTT